MGMAPGVRDAAIAWPGLNEYDSEAVISAVYPHKLEKPTSPEMYRHHFRLLRDGLTNARRTKRIDAITGEFKAIVERYVARTYPKKGAAA